MAKKKARKSNKRSPGGGAIRRKLVEAAKSAQKKAYCPYSRYPVGAAVLAESGRIYSGCNVENASFGLSICAERTAIFNAVMHGEKKIKAVCVAAKSATPCGACRQVIVEFAAKDAEMICVDWQPQEKKEKVTCMKVSRMMYKPFDPSEAGL
ncbi:MAG TPA: cytidine deaminase [Elusimicrobia bacterium]|nr:cytidine deaminase [Desulfobacterales bacterium]HBE88334.1 cytidine deaminase [Elusimicrobiota bacterium]